MNAVRRKIESQKGASITFALLIFLVCAVVSSVVIVAGSTSAGRMSQIAEFDQRYYAVTSAARLLKSEIDGKTLVVTYEDTTDEDGNPIKTYKALYQGEAGERNTILSDASKLLAKYLIEETDSIPSRTFSLETDIDDPTGPDLQCTVVETMGTNGLLTFKINNTNGTDTTTYRVEIVFSSNRKETVDAATGQKKTILEWKFHSMKKVRNPLASGGEGGDGGDGGGGE